MQFQSRIEPHFCVVLFLPWIEISSVRVYNKLIDIVYDCEKGFSMDDSIWIFLFVVLLLVFFLGVATYVVHSLIHPPKRTLEQTKQLELERTPDLYQTHLDWKVEDFWVSGKDQTRLACKLFKAPMIKEKRSLVLIAHGYSYTHHGSIKYASMMRDLGIDCVVFDQRNHGLSEGNQTTMGYLESIDAATVLKETITKFGPYHKIGLFGESMGAVTVLLMTKYIPSIDFIIADCAFSSLDTLVRDQLRKRRLMVFPIKWMASILFKIRVGVYFNQISPLKAIKDIHVPILFIHGLADRYIYPLHTKQLVDAYQGPKQAYFAINDSKHAESYRKNRDRYTEEVHKFLQQYVDFKN